MEMRSVKWLGYNAVEMVQPGSVIRIVYTNRHMVTATISGPRGVRAGREEEAAFFDNVEITE
jgi:hypothetical protein